MSKMKKWLNNWFKESVEFYGQCFVMEFIIDRTEEEHKL